MKIKTILAAMIMLLTTLPAMSAADHVSVSGQALKAIPAASRAALVKRFQAGEKLTPEEMVTVYYGQAFTPGYVPAQAEKTIDEAYAAKDFPRTLTLVDELLESNPVALNQLFRGFVAAKSSAAAPVKARAGSFVTRINNICEVIFATGTGLSMDDPFLTLTQEDALAFVRNYLQPESIIGTSRIADMDAVKVRWPGQEEDVIFYFARPK